MKTKVVAQDVNHQPYITDLLHTLFSMQKTSSYTDCTLISSDGTPVPAHLPMLSLSWPRLEQLLPPSDGLCSCQCCVPGIALSGEAETVQAVLELAYTGKSGVLGVEGERKVKELLLQVLGIEWDLERVDENDSEYNNSRNKLHEGLTIPSKHKSDSPNKESLADGMIITPVDANVKAKKFVSYFKFPVIEKKEGSKSVLPRKPNAKKAVTVTSSRPLHLSEKNENNEHEKCSGPNRDLDIDHSSEVLESLPELKRFASKETGLPLNHVQVTESVSVLSFLPPRVPEKVNQSPVENSSEFFNPSTSLRDYCHIGLKGNKELKEHLFKGVNHTECVVKQATEMVRMAENGERKFVCKECGKGFKTSRDFTRHSNVHSKQMTFVCDVEGCAKTYIRRDSVTLHKKVVHEGSFYECPECKKRFGQKRHLNRHTQSVHDKIRAFKCEQCNKSFSEARNLIRHTQCVHDNIRAFKCEQCNKSFSEARHLIRHTQSVHDKIRAFKCEQCNNSFSEARNKRNHMKRFHSNNHFPDKGSDLRHALTKDEKAQRVESTEPQPPMVIIKEEALFLDDYQN